MKYILICILFLILASFVCIKLKQDKDIKMDSENKSNSLTENSCLSEEEIKNLNTLTEEEEAVIKYGATERPFTGALLHNKEDGDYLCKQCNAVLFKSDAKFDSRSGWPSFDEAVKDSIEYIKDKDGRRTEVKCKNCGAHLGHVFYGEGFTEKNARYCVNSVSLQFKSKNDLSSNK